MAAALAGCTGGTLWPGAGTRVDRDALPALVRGAADPGSPEDYGVCGAALAVDRMARAPEGPTPARAADTQGRLLNMTLSSPDPGLSFAIGAAVSEMSETDRRNLVDRVPACRVRYGRYFP